MTPRTDAERRARYRKALKALARKVDRLGIAPRRAIQKAYDAVRRAIDTDQSV